jgi:hypothetical protein
MKFVCIGRKEMYVFILYVHYLNRTRKTKYKEWMYPIHVVVKRMK